MKLVVRGCYTETGNLIADVFAEASELLGSNAQSCPCLMMMQIGLGVGRGTTYSQAYADIDSVGTPLQARDFTKAVIFLRHDPRVQGEEVA